MDSRERLSYISLPRATVLVVCFIIKVTSEDRFFYPPFLKGGQGGFYKSLKSP